ncbi:MULTISPECIES: acyl-CoA thioesterase [unclassified Rhodococcus (in: high G+C Gram-positive bacteria)]|jgi:acyl-CoA thioester hydrolase|uniref:acyl-CoA thioesterase n=1 Tax=unclassified Rhodococcus (in: high G+C Gram-positive bacteria) TaxID=192944 RepID=UPI0003828E7B|nr:acyl-CoA thioesterase [Rhodococcus sp. DK17]
MTMYPLDRLPLDKYPCQRDLSLVFGDIDTVGHVNNVAIARFFEEARVHLYRMVDSYLSEKRPMRMVLAHVEIDYAAEVSYPGEVQLGIGVHEIGRTSVRQGAALFQGGRCVAVSRSVDVNTIEGQAGAAGLSEDYRLALHKCLLPQIQL